jgi:hypothetical protein
MLGPPPEGVSVESLAAKVAVSWVLMLPAHYRIIEGPKGPPLAGFEQHLASPNN